MNIKKCLKEPGASLLVNTAVKGDVNSLDPTDKSQIRSQMWKTFTNRWIMDTDFYYGISNYSKQILGAFKNYILLLTLTTRALIDCQSGRMAFQS